MNKGLNIFLVVLLCVVVYIGLLLSFYSSKNVETSNPYLGDAKSTRGTYGTYAVSANSMGSNMATISVRSANSIFHHRPVCSYAPAASMPTYSQSPIGGTLSKSVASPIYTTSSAEFHSFGGGGNSGSVSVSGGAVSAASPSASATGLTTTMPSTSAYAYNTNRNTRSNTGDLSTLTSGEFATASSYAGIGQTTAGGPMGIRGRRNANGLDDNFIDWLDGLIGDGSPNEWYAYKIGDVFYFNYDNLYDLYIQAVENGQLPEGVSWEMFLQWFKGQSDTYAFPIPSGVWFMTVLALGYALMIYFKKRKLQKQL